MLQRAVRNEILQSELLDWSCSRSLRLEFSGGYRRRSTPFPRGLDRNGANLQHMRAT